MDNISSRNEWVFGKITNPLQDKEYILRNNIINMLNITTKIFKYENLPETINNKDLEIQLQVGGYSIWKEVDGKLYTFLGGLGGEPNPYYLPTIATIANPALRFNGNFKIDDECVVMLNDHFYQGLMPMHNKFGSLLTEAEISLRYAIINSRIPALAEADNDRTFKSAENLFNKIENGESFGVVGSREFFDGLRTHEFSKKSHIIDIIESIQYIKGSWFNASGLRSVFNMKREAINEAEAILNDDVLFPTLDVMLECRRLGLEKVNKKYNRNITVDYDSVWLNNFKREKISLEIEKNEANATENNIEEIEVNDDEVEWNC